MQRPRTNAKKKKKKISLTDKRAADISKRTWVSHTYRNQINYIENLLHCSNFIFALTHSYHTYFLLSICIYICCYLTRALRCSPHSISPSVIHFCLYFYYFRSKLQICNTCIVQAHGFPITDASVFWFFYFKPNTLFHKVQYIQFYVYARRTLQILEYYVCTSI